MNPFSSSKTTDSTSTTQPWSVQQPYLQSAFGQAANVEANANANTYTGQQVSQFTPDQLATFQSMIGYGGNSTGAQASAAAGTNLTNMGSNALSSAMTDLSGYKPQGGTQSNIDAATAYANNPATQGMIDAATQDARRAVSENALPQLARSDVASGNAMSSKDAISQGVINRGLADTVANTSANIRGQQFNNGLSLAEQNSESNNSNALQALLGRVSGANSAVNSGVNATGNSISQQGSLFDLANAGGAGMQSSGQAAIDNAKGMSEYANNNAWTNLQNFYNIIGGQNWGSTKTGSSTETSDPSLWSDAGSVMGTLGSLMKLSDRRMKKDIEMIGHAPNGLPVYLYRYIGDDSVPREVGLMAQDVETFRPEAVTEIGGLKHVNYELALA
jgi:hypothetical protein